MTVRLGSSAIQRRTSSRTSRAAPTSSATVGSSRNRMRGFVMRPRIRFIFWRMPLESAETRRSAASLSPSRSRSSSILRFDGALGMP